MRSYLFNPFSSFWNFVIKYHGQGGTTTWGELKVWFEFIIWERAITLIEDLFGNYDRRVHQHTMPLTVLYFYPSPNWRFTGFCFLLRCEMEGWEWKIEYSFHSCDLIWGCNKYHRVSSHPVSGFAYYCSSHEPYD